MKTELDHPCKDTCSGWKQGYDRGYTHGLTQFKKSQNDLVQERNDYFKALQKAVNAIQSDYCLYDDEENCNCSYHNARKILTKYSHGEKGNKI